MLNDSKNLNSKSEVVTGDYEGSINITRTIIGSPNDDIINNITEKHFNVSVKKNLDGKNVYFFDDFNPSLDLEIGYSYIFDQSDPSNMHHPLLFSSTPNGIHLGGEIIDGDVLREGIPGTEGAYTRIYISGSHNELYYFCQNHSGMGNKVNFFSPHNIYNGQILNGLDGNDIIKGGTGMDIINGGKGDDILSGGGNQSVNSFIPNGNTFVFNPNFGNDIIKDFRDGYDNLKFEGFSDKELNSMIESSSEKGERKIIFNDGSSITFEGIFAIETKHLINGEIFLNWVRDWGVKKPGTIKFWIDPGGTTHFATDLNNYHTSDIPSVDQYNWMRSLTEEIQKEIGVVFEEVDTIDEADIPFIVTSKEANISSLSSSGGPSEGLTFKQANIKLNVSNAVGNDWNKIFTHELGHLLGLEHPWDKKSGDNDISVLNGREITSNDVVTDRTITAYNGWPEIIKNDGFRPLDIAALKEIWGEPKSYNMSKIKPIGSIEDQRVEVGKSINLSDFISPNEFDGDLITWFQLWDSNNGNSFVLNGETVDASNGYWLEASLLKNVSLVSDTQVSSQTIYIQSYDGNEISQWDSFSLNTIASEKNLTIKPIGSIEDQRVEVGKSINLSDFISPNEFDGDLITWFQLWDSNNGNSFVLNGETVDASNGYWLEASLLKNVSLVSDTQVSSQTIYIQSYDGNEISQWDSFSFITEIA